MSAKPILSIVIPAYNNEEYTRRTLSSVLQQSYRPLRVYLVDDASPDSLAGLADWFAHSKDPEIEFVYVRNERNLVADSLYVCYDLIQTPWMVQLHHDDELLDADFLRDAMSLATENPDLGIVWANAETEFSQQVMIRDSRQSWTVLSGAAFIRYLLANGHTAWSSVVYRADWLKELGFPAPPFLIDNRVKARTGLDTDEGMSSLYLLATRCNAAVSGKVVAQRGEPDTAYSRSDLWRTPGHSLFFIYYGTYLALRGDPNTRLISRLARASCLLYGLPRRERRLKRAIDAELGRSVGLSSFYTFVRLTSLCRVNNYALLAWIAWISHDYAEFGRVLLWSSLDMSRRLSNRLLGRVAEVGASGH